MVYSFLLPIFADELLQVKKESEKSIQEITHERNALQEKVKSSVNLSEKQLRELYNTMEDKSQRIANLEQDLMDVHKKDEKISELELEINILRGIRCYFVEGSTVNDSSQDFFANFKLSYFLLNFYHACHFPISQ